MSTARNLGASAALALTLGGIVSVVALAQPHHATVDLVTPQTAVPVAATSSPSSTTTTVPAVTTTTPATARPVATPTTAAPRTTAPTVSTGTPAPAPVRHAQIAPAPVDTAANTQNATQPAQQRPLPTVPGTTTGPTGQFGPTSGITAPAHP